MLVGTRASGFRNWRPFLFSATERHKTSPQLCRGNFQGEPTARAKLQAPEEARDLGDCNCPRHTARLTRMAPASRLTSPIRSADNSPPRVRVSPASPYTVRYGSTAAAT